MIVKSLNLKNFRNYKNSTFSFKPGINILLGKNGIGKTNIVEAIYYLALTKSFRTNFDEVLIKENEEFAIIEATISDKISNNYRIVLSKQGKNIKIDNNSLQSISDYISKLNYFIYSRRYENN